MKLLPLGRIVGVVAPISLSCLLYGGVATAYCEPVQRIFDAQTNGIRFKVAASLSSDLASAYAAQHYGSPKASLWVDIRISSEAKGSRFYGVVAKKFSNVLTARSAEQTYWQDARCHQRRGFPKTTVTSINGSIVTDDARKIRVYARTRQLGLPLPADEITPGRRISLGANRNVILAYRSRTKSSHLLVDVKIYAFNCNLGAGSLGATDGHAHKQ